MTFTQAKPDLPADRIAGYSAMAEPLLNMLSNSEYYDPAGPGDFRENVNRLIPVKPSFLQLADWFLQSRGGIQVATSKRTGKVTMADLNETIEWKRFVLDHHDKLKVSNTQTYRLNDDETEARQEHIEELVSGSQYTFTYRAADVGATVAFSVKASGFKREFDANGNEIPGSRKSWSTA